METGSLFETTEIRIQKIGMQSIENKKIPRTIRPRKHNTHFTIHLKSLNPLPPTYFNSINATHSTCVSVCGNTLVLVDLYLNSSNCNYNSYKAILFLGSVYFLYFISAIFLQYE